MSSITQDYHFINQGLLSQYPQFANDDLDLDAEEKEIYEDILRDEYNGKHLIQSNSAPSLVFIEEDSTDRINQKKDLADKVNQIGQKTVKSNADAILTDERTFVYCFIDLTGGGRQASAAIAAAFTLAHGSPVVSGALGVAVIPIALLGTGFLCVITAAAWTLPDAVKALKSASEELEKAKIGENTNTPAELEAKLAVQIAKLGVANHSFYLAMGAAQISSGVVTLCGAEAAHVFHYTPILTGSAASTATMVTGAGLGAIYVVRGAIMLTRAVKSYRQVHEFHNQFKECLLEQNSVEAAMSFMRTAEEQNPAYLNRRVDASCLEKKDKEGNISQYTSLGIRDKNGKFTKYSSDEERLQYLERVDKGIYTEELKHKVAMAIAIAMIVGGILAIIGATVLTGGIGAIAIALVSAVFFMSMEYIFLTYDSSRAFERLRDSLYKTPTWLKNPEPIQLISPPSQQVLIEREDLLEKI